MVRAETWSPMVIDDAAVVEMRVRVSAFAGLLLTAMNPSSSIVAAPRARFSPA